MRWTKEERCCWICWSSCDPCGPDSPARPAVSCGPPGPRSPCGPCSPCGPRGPSRRRWRRRGGGSLQLPPRRCSPPPRYSWQVWWKARLAGPKACLQLWPPPPMYFRQVFLAGPQTQEILFKSHLLVTFQTSCTFVVTMMMFNKNIFATNSIIAFAVTTFGCFRQKVDFYDLTKKKFLECFLG